MRIAVLATMRFVIAVLLAGCTSPDPDLPVTIERGVYGLTLSVCDDASTCTRRDLPAANMPVDASQSWTPVASATSDDSGLFQLDVPDGTYELCVRFPSSSSCTPITVNGELVRVDWESGPGGGGWYLGGR